MRLAYRVHPGRGPHLLLLHGFLTGPAQWVANLDALAEQCIPVTAWLWGHAGAASPEDPAAYTPDAYVAALDAIREALNVDQWFLLGYSLGAGLTLRYALTHPHRVAGHLFTNSTSALADSEQQRLWRARAPAAAEMVAAGGHAAMERIAVHPRHARKLPAPIYRAIREEARHHDPAGIARTMRYTNPATSVRDDLGGNRRPARLIWGNRERRFRPLAEYAVRHMPLLEVAELDAGHGMNMEVPAAFNRAVTEFLTRCRRTDGPQAARNG